MTELHGNTYAGAIFLIILGLLILTVRALTAWWKFSKHWRFQRRYKREQAEQEAKREKFLEGHDHSVDAEPAAAKAS